MCEECRGWRLGCPISSSTERTPNRHPAASESSREDEAVQFSVRGPARVVAGSRRWVRTSSSRGSDWVARLPRPWESRVGFPASAFASCSSRRAFFNPRSRWRDRARANVRDMAGVGAYIGGKWEVRTGR